MDAEFEKAPLAGYPVMAGGKADLNAPEIQAEQVFRTVMNGKPVLFRDAKAVLTFSEGFAHKKLCTGPVLNCGDACTYGCVYCYVGLVARKFTKATLGQQAHQDVVIRRKNALAVLDDNLQKVSRAEKDSPHVCFTSTLVDPAGNMDLVRETAAAVTMILQRTSWDVRILSKSNLLPKVAELIPEEFKNRVIYGVSVGTLDDGLAKAIETGTPLVSKRLQSLHWLQDNGYRTFGMICPSLPQADYDQFSRDACAAIRLDKCEHVWAEPINVRGESAIATVRALREAGYNVEAAMVEHVFAPGNEQHWDDYAKATFEAHARNIGPDKLRFLHYPRKAALGWWTPQQARGAILLGANAEKAEGEHRPAEREQTVVRAPSFEAAVEASIMPCTELGNLGIPPRQPLLGDWMKEGDYGLVFAPRGLGKTWMALGIGVAVANGTSFGPWSAPEARKVLYVDGEMPVDAIDHRIRGLGGGENLEVLSHEALFHRGGESLNLAQKSHQDVLTMIVADRGVKLLILDNLSCLVGGVKENDADSWEPLKRWFLELRRRRVAIVLVHHAGRNGEMRGTSKREDDAFWVMRLDPVARQGGDGVLLRSSFSKNRNSARAEIPLEWAFSPSPSGRVDVLARLVASAAAVRQLVEAGETSATAIAEKLAVTKSCVSKHADDACAAGWIHRAGRKYLPGPKPVEPVSIAEGIGEKQETKPAKAA